MTEPTLGARLGRLARALLDATLLLALLLVLGLWLLAGRVQDLTQGSATAAIARAAPEIRAEISARTGDIAEAAERIRSLDARIEAALAAGAGRSDSAITAELAALRGEVRGLTETLDALRTQVAGLRADVSGSLRAAARQLLLDAADRLGPSIPEK